MKSGYQTDYEKTLSEQLDNANRERIIRNHFIELHKKLFSLEEDIRTLKEGEVILTLESTDKDSKRHFTARIISWERIDGNFKIRTRIQTPKK